MPISFLAERYFHKPTFNKLTAWQGIEEHSYSRMPSSRDDFFFIVKGAWAMVLKAGFLQFLPGKMTEDSAGNKLLSLPTHWAFHAHPPPADSSDFPSRQHSIRSLHLGFWAPLTNDSFVISQLGMEEGGVIPAHGAEASQLLYSLHSPWSRDFTASVLLAFSLVSSHFYDWGTAHRRQTVITVNKCEHFCHQLNS